MSSPLTKVQIWSAPVTLGSIIIAGLIAALLSDGIGDVLSWIALGAPSAVCLRYVLFPLRRNEQQSPGANSLARHSAPRG